MQILPLAKPIRLSYMFMIIVSTDFLILGLVGKYFVSIIIGETVS